MNAIDWTKPLELMDGTPVRLFPYPGKEPDGGGHYNVDIADGDPNLWFVDADGTCNGEPFLRNRAEPEPQIASYIENFSEYPTLRDRFAMAALATIESRTPPDFAAKRAYAIAEAMLAERAK